MPLNELACRRLAENMSRVRARIADAAVRSGRTAADVTLVAVTKYVDADVTAAVAALCADLGESRPQDLWEKAERLASVGAANLRWHLIGHLQRNKVRRTLPRVSLIHSADSWRLLEELNGEAAKQTLQVAALLEVNVSGDASKGGFAAHEMESVLVRCAELPQVKIQGLMAMSGLQSDDATTRREFASLRKLRDRCEANCPPHVSLQELSMGMSGDFEIAIEEGATLVRIGSALFEGVTS